MLLAFSERGTPQALPSSSEADAPRKATSIRSSPLAMALPRPPCERNTTGSLRRPWEMASASSPRRPEVEMPVITPLLMCSMSGLWTSERLEAASLRSLKPICASLSTTRFTTLSPPRKWWWKLMVMPSLRPERRMASSSVTTLEFLIALPPCQLRRQQRPGRWFALHAAQPDGLPFFH